MPEGDTIHHAARRVRAALVDRAIEAIEAPHPRHRLDRWPERLEGRAVRSVDASQASTRGARRPASRTTRRSRSSREVRPLMRDSAERGGPRPLAWVYERAGLPCRRCNTPIRACGQGDDNRTTYWCPRCQA